MFDNTNTYSLRSVTDEDAIRYDADFTKLSRKALLRLFEQERQDWLAAGMNEADIFKIHFGEQDENGKLVKPKDGSYGGDYLVWLSERKHRRRDRKYAPGAPVAIDVVDPDHAWIGSERSGIDDVDFEIDLEAALSTLTEMQRFCFAEAVIKGNTHRSVADKLGIAHQNVDRHIKAAKKKMKNYFSG